MLPSFPIRFERTSNAYNGDIPDDAWLDAGQAKTQRGAQRKIYKLDQERGGASGWLFNTRAIDADGEHWTLRDLSMAIRYA